MDDRQLRKIVMNISSIKPGALIQTGSCGIWLDFDENFTNSFTMKQQAILFVISVVKIDSLCKMYVYSLDHERFGFIDTFYDHGYMTLDWIEIK